MFGISLARLAWLGRWPRRIAALLCLLLAAAEAFTSHAARAPDTGRAAAARPANPIAALLSAGQLAAPIVVSGGPVTAYLRAGDRVDVYAAPVLAAASALGCGAAANGPPVGTGLTVLAVPTPAGGPDAADGDRLVVAVDRTTAGRLASLQGCSMLAVLDKFP